MTFVKKRRLTSSQLIMYGFALLILFGALLLCLPISSADGKSCSFLDALFTSTSAVCVTGLVVRDTATSWSMFGQLILLILIQIGGLGIIMAGTAITIVSGKKIGLMQRSAMADSISVNHLGGIIRMTKMVLYVTAAVEGIGALLLSFAFIPEFGFFKGLWYSLFHSISAFCNAGFDLMGMKAPYSSLTFFSANGLVNAAVMMLIIVGGISFMTWDDIRINKWKYKKWSMQTKIILTTSAALILVPSVLFFFLEYSSLPAAERIYASLFQAVTARTAGFNTMDLEQMSSSGKLLMCFLMLIGGSPGSTAGGLKTTTIAVVFLGAAAVVRNKTDVECFGRAIDSTVLHRANAIFILYLMTGLGSGAILARIENVPLITALFETCSAIGTVGLSLGLTPALHTISRIMIMILMFTGRIGTLTLIYAVFHTSQKQSPIKLIKADIVVG